VHHIGYEVTIEQFNDFEFMEWLQNKFTNFQNIHYTITQFMQLNWQCMIQFVVDLNIQMIKGCLIWNLFKLQVQVNLFEKDTKGKRTYVCIKEVSIYLQM